ncbi:MAG: B12-binding domain-containing radical SAM protein [Bradyrhizobium sp.]|nr:B12-binding domain-containing radical SAM protein [Bradyrhizobium sp.]
MGLLYLAAELQRHDHIVDILDLQALGGNDLLTARLMTFNPEVVGISSTSPSHKAAIEVARITKAFVPNAVIVKGGVHETYCSAHTIANVAEIDYSVCGEADYSFVLLLYALEKNAPLSRVPGIVFRNSNGEIERTAMPKTRIALDSVPPLPRYLLGNSSYYNFRIFDGRRTTQVQTMRGCPYKCSFCNQRNQAVNAASIECVVAELARLEADAYEAVFFDDATFTVNQKRTLSLVQTLQRSGISLQFAAQTRSECVTEPLLYEMAKAGFRYLSFGLETTDESALKQLLKSTSPHAHADHTARAVENCRNCGIESCLNIIVGLPDETNETLLRTFDFANKLKPTFVSLSAYALYPHQDRMTAQQYHEGVSLGPIWNHYDEGYGAVHPHMSEARAEEVLLLARRELGNRLELV